MSNSKKIVVISYVFNLSNTVRAYAVYNAIKKQYNTKVLYADYDHYSKKKVIYKNADFLDINVPKYRKNLSLMRMLSTVTFGIKSIYYLKKIKPDGIYVVCPPNFGAYLATIYCKRNKIPCVIDIVDLHPESIPLNENMKKAADFMGLFVWKKFRSLAIKNTTKVVVECNYYKNFIEKKFHEKVSTIYIAKQSTYKYANSLDTNEKKINIVYLGSIGHIYDFESLVKIGMELIKENVPVELHIIGDGEKRSWLEDRLKTEGIPYTYYGKIFDELEKEKIMRLCDFGFNGFKDQTSVGLSYKSLDYMDYGLALINSTKEDTWNLINKHKAGINYSSEDISCLVKKLIELTPNDIYKMKKNSRLMFEEYFESDTFEKNVMSKINELL